MQGSFEISCRRQPDGVTAIGQQMISAPWHLSKPYWDGKILLVQAVNVTAGIFAGDHLAFQVKVEPGASVLLTSPSASRIHTMPDGEASLQQTINVAGDAWLEWMPELFIPQKNCLYRQITEINVEAGGSLYAVETLAPGRVAFGESFEFNRITWSTRVHHGGRLILSERYPLSTRDHSLNDLKTNRRSRYFANAILIYPAVLPFRDWQTNLLATCRDQLMIGATRLCEGVYLFRVIADTSELLKEALTALRSMLSTSIPLLGQSTRKL